MIQVYVTTNPNADVLVSFNSLDYTFLIGSKAQYIPNGGILSLVDSNGKAYNFHEDAYQFYVNGVLWASTFEALATEFNDNLFSSNSVSPVPSESTTIRAAVALTGAYVATTAVQVTNRAKIHFDFVFGGAPANSGNVIGIVQVSDDGTNWININNLVASVALASDGAASPFQAGTVFRQYSAEYAAIAIPYVTGNLPTLPIRVSYDTGYGKYYRIQLRASDVAGISSGAPATFPTLAITATLQ